MMAVNLMPARRMEARRRGARLRLWAAAVAAWSLLLIVGTGSFRASWADERGQLAAMIEATAARTEAAAEALGVVQRDLREAQRTLRAHEAVADKPDWGLLLAIIAAQLGDEAVLNECFLQPETIATARSPRSNQGRSSAADGSVRPARFILTLAGYTTTTQGPTQLALALEQTGLFEKVTLVESRRTTLLGHEATSFRLQLRLTDAGAEIE